MTRIGVASALFFLGIGISGASASEPPQGKQASYPTFGIAFREPEAWVKRVKDRGGIIVWWTSPDSKPDKPLAMIIIECGPPTDRSLDEAARGLARNFHGVVDDRPSTLDGTRALRIIAKNDSGSLRPVEGLAAVHDGRLYLIMGGVTAGHSVKDELEAIRASWKWTQLEPPFKHLEFRDEPLYFGKDTISINVPELMHIYRGEEPDRVLSLGLYNVVRNAPDFVLNAQLVPVAPVQSLDEYKRRLADGLQAQYMLKKPIEWRTLTDTPTRVVSDTFEAEVPEKAGGPKHATFIRWALVKLDDGRLVSVNFTLPPDAPGDQSIYIGLVDRIVESIRPRPGAVKPRTRGVDPVGAVR